MATSTKIVLLLACCMTLLCSSLGAVGNGYQISSLNNTGDGGIQAILDVIANTDTFGPDIQQLQVIASYETKDRIHVRITDNINTRWEVPKDLISRQDTSASSSSDLFPKDYQHNNPSNQLQFFYTNNPFGFAITRPSSGEVLFNCTPSSAANFGPLVFKDQYLELSTDMPTYASLYGLGESTRPAGFRLISGNTYTLWTSDIPSITPNMDLYGAFPFYMDMRPSGNTHGVLFLNSNGMDVLYQDEYLTYKTIGGILDLYFFGGPSPLSVVQQYTEIVGRPAPMPYWSLGFHQSRYGYKNVSVLEDVVAKYASANIPLEVMWSDIDHMDARQDFTFDPINYPQSEVSNFVQTLHAAGQRYVLIIDPGIRVDNNYTTYTNGMKNDIFIKSSSGSSPYLAQVWPGPVYFPDFLNPNTQSYWTNEISNFQKLAQFDGLWIDMNEASNFCSGVTCTFLSDGSPCPSPDAPTTCCLNCNNSQGSKWDYPPYKINNAASQRDLGGKTIATSAVHYGGILEYDAHNLYGMSEAMVTNRALQSVLQKRPFVLSRSTFVGAGKFTAHWTGDNGATWDDLRYSIVSVLNSGLVGIPMVGADICGFLFDTTEELCNRWIQLGAFYPFARDHSDINSKPQELYLWPSVAQSARKALGLRYRLLPYLYTLVFEAHVTGAPIARALFFSFPNEAQALNINSQFLLGKGIMVSPVLVSNATTVNAYFPQGIWYSLFDYSQLVDAGNGSSQVLSAPWDTINVHVNEGSIIPMQDPASTTSLARKTPFTLVVAFSLQPYSLAAGYLFLDDGESIDMELVDGSSTFVTYNASKSTGGGSLTSNVTYGNFAFNQGLLLQNLVLFGLQAAPASVSINNAPSDSVTIQQISAHAVQISGLKIPVGNIFVVSWST